MAVSTTRTVQNRRCSEAWLTEIACGSITVATQDIFVPATDAKAECRIGADDGHLSLRPYHPAI
jgi:hypothetical protein